MNNIIPFHQSNRETFRRKEPAVILSIVTPIPDMLKEIHRAEQRMMSIGQKGTAKDIMDAAHVLEIIRSKTLNYAKSPFTHLLKS